MDDSQFVIGIDGGGTSTVCLLASVRGEIVARADAPASNHRKSDLTEARGAIAEGIKRLARQSIGSDGFARGQLVSVCAGLAGVDTRRDAETLHDVLCDMLAGVAPCARLQVVNDGQIGLQGALGTDAGVLVISGTGSIVWAQCDDGRRIRVGGWDYILSDEGSGYSIGSRALRAVAAAHDRRTQETSLTGYVLAAFDATDFDDLLEHIYHEEMTPARIASLAPVVDRAASEGDSVAATVIDESASELVGLTCAASRRAGLCGASFPVVPLGGVLLANGFFADLFRRRLSDAMRGAFFVEPRHTPAEGAVLLALEMIESNACQSRASLIDDFSRAGTI